MNWEIVGTAASVIVLISFLMKGEKNIRLVNMIGAVLFIVYGVMSNAFSIWFLNTGLLIIQIVKLFQMNKAEKQ